MSWPERAVAWLYRNQVKVFLTLAAVVALLTLAGF